MIKNNFIIIFIVYVAELPDIFYFEVHPIWLKSFKIRTYRVYCA
jgi:hypothetical protein